MNKELTLGSLFDGSGGFPLAAKMVGIKPIWASEIEPFPIRVTTKRMPEVKHLGDICKIKGDKIEPVDIISFGSPCQDLSIAGKRGGLKGSQSNLFFEAIRVIKEMRWKTNGEKPRYILWENVPEAFSSNNGKDFKRILDEVLSVKGAFPSVPMPHKNKWSYADIFMGEEFSLAYRVLDAKYFGVPQRRRRVFLVADFNGGRAGQILFDQDCLSWHLKKSREKGKRYTATPKDCSGETICIADQGGERIDFVDNISPTLRAKGGQPPFVYDYTSAQHASYDATSQCETASDLPDVRKAHVVRSVYDIRQTSENTKNERHNIYACDVSRTIDTSGNPPTRNQGGVAIVEDIYSMSKNSHFIKADKNITSSLVATDYKDPPVVFNKYVRRLTPTECGRLQGFPDDWCKNLETDHPTNEEMVFWREVFQTDGGIRGLKSSKTDKKIRKWLKNPHTDSAEYKMWGNGVALPCVVYILKRIAEIA